MNPLTDFQKDEVFYRALCDLKPLEDSPLSEMLRGLALVYMDNLLKFLDGDKKKQGRKKK